MIKLKTKGTFTKELPSDKELSNSRRTVIGAVYSFVTPKKNQKTIFNSRF